MAESGRSKNDASLIRACCDGRSDAWAELIRRYRRLIYSIPFSYRLTGDQADDIFQRVSLKLFENLSGLRNVDGLASWIVVTTRRECRLVHRTESRFRGIEDGDVEVLADDSPAVVDSIEEVEKEHAVLLALEQVGEPCRSLLRALYVEEPTPSYEEIGRRLGRPVGSLGPTRSRCLQKLQKLYRRSLGSRAVDGDVSTAEQVSPLEGPEKGMG